MPRLAIKTARPRRALPAGPPQLLAAIAHYDALTAQNKQPSRAAVARLFGVAPKTFNNHRGARADRPMTHAAPGRPTLLGPTSEAHIATRVGFAAQVHMPMNSMELSLAAKSLATANKKRFNTASGLPGVKWMRGFKRRHRLVPRVAQPVKKDRVAAERDTDAVTDWFATTPPWTCRATRRRGRPTATVPTVFSTRTRAACSSAPPRRRCSSRAARRPPSAPEPTPARG